MQVTDSGEKRCLGMWRHQRHLMPLIDSCCWSGELHANLPLRRLNLAEWIKELASFCRVCARVCVYVWAVPRWGTIIGLKQLVIGRAHKSRKRATSLALCAPPLAGLATALGHNWWGVGERERGTATLNEDTHTHTAVHLVDTGATWRN